MHANSNFISLFDAQIKLSLVIICDAFCDNYFPFYFPASFFIFIYFSARQNKKIIFFTQLILFAFKRPFYGEEATQNEFLQHKWTFAIKQAREVLKEVFFCSDD